MKVNEYYSNLIKRAIAGERGDVKCMVFLKHGFDYIIPWELNGKEIGTGVTLSNTKGAET